MTSANHQGYLLIFNKQKENNHWEDFLLPCYCKK